MGTAAALCPLPHGNRLAFPAAWHSIIVGWAPLCSYAGQHICEGICPQWLWNSQYSSAWVSGRRSMIKPETLH